ncbi:MAG: helix-turn-helix transcriptional regulator [Pirellulales bacterium]
MGKKRFRRVVRAATEDEKRRHEAIRKKVTQEIPPAPGAGRKASPPGIPSQIRAAREARGLTWYAAAKQAGIPNPNTVRDIEYGRDATLSSVQALAKALGLELQLVEAGAL